jgi:hypothetical protein
VVQGVVGVVLGLDLGQALVDVIAVGLSNAAGVVFGIKEVDVDAPGAVRLEGLEEPPCPSGLRRGVLDGLVREPYAFDDDVVGHVATGVGGGVAGNPGDCATEWNITAHDRGEPAV